MKYQSKDRKLGTRQNIKMVGDFLDERARTALDIGCDEATISVHLSNLGLKVDAIEASAEVAAEAAAFIAANKAPVALQQKILSLDELKAMPVYDVTCLLSVYHQIVEHNSIEYGNAFLVALYQKTNLQLFFQPCMIHLKHRVRMPFVENNTADALHYFSSILRTSGLPVHAQFIGYSLNGLPAADPFRPMFLFEKKKSRQVVEIPSMERGRLGGRLTGELVHVNLEETVSAHALQSFGRNGWHHFTEACLLISQAGVQKQPRLAAAADALTNYYDKFQPENFGEIWRRAGLSTDIGLLAGQPTRHYCNWLPWAEPCDTLADMQAGVTRCGAWPAGDCHAYGPLSPDERLRELSRIHAVLSKLSNDGYEPDVNLDGYIRGQILLRGTESRFLVSAGQHRLAALAALGYNQFLAKFQPGRSKVIDVAKVQSWPQVANGTYTEQQAINVFNGLFEANGKKLHENLLTVPIKRRPAPLELPSVQSYQTVATEANGWSDQYGALSVAANYARVTLANGHRLHAYWSHGCDGPWYNFSPALLCNNTPNARALPVLVARLDQAELLQAHGYAQARAIGLPIIYTRSSGLPRIPGSLLVVPTHTLAGEKFPDRSAFEAYAHEIEQAAVGFSRVVVCIHPSCRQNGLWVTEFSRLGFEIVYGAQSNDLNALVRMRCLFEQFETVTTNGWGSHVAYALAFGAKVSIHGSQPVRSEADYLRDTAWAADPAALKKLLSPEVRAEEKAFLQELHVEPAAAVSNVEMGSWLIGAGHQISPAEMRTLLAQIIRPVAGAAQSPAVPLQGHTVGIEEARRIRHESRDGARELLQAGRRAEAIKALIRAVQADVASKNPAIMVESLFEVSEELRALEPTQADFLRAQAEKIALTNGIKWSPTSVAVAS